MKSDMFDLPTHYKDRRFVSVCIYTRTLARITSIHGPLAVQKSSRGNDVLQMKANEPH